MRFWKKASPPCDTLDLEELIDAASKDTDTFYAYLSRTDYADGVKALKDGFSAFEKWCDDRQTALVKEISRQDYFTVAPLLGYVTARQNRDFYRAHYYFRQAEQPARWSASVQRLRDL